MKKRNIAVICAAIVFCAVILALIVYPHLEFKAGGKLYAFRYSDDFSEFEENASYNEIYFYNEKHDVSLKTFQEDHFWIFHRFTFEYEEGDMRETMFMLEEEYIEYWLDNAEITDNPCEIDIEKLIEGKRAIVSGKKYSGNEYDKAVYYMLDGRENVLYVFESEGLTVIQVGYPDESPQYIAYE